uniref:Phosphoglycerate kinase n=2 Tax=Rhizophora mucronata TaxID=61149 RepID=A0A2P2J2F4_RHIMU
MGELLNLPELAVPINRQRLYYYGCPTPSKTHALPLLRAAAKSPSFSDKTVQSPKLPGVVQSSFQGGLQAVDRFTSSPDYKAACCDEGGSEAIPCIQTLREFPKEKLMSKVVMVRFDSTVLLGEEWGPCSQSFCNAVYTIRHLREGGARVVITSDWSNRTRSKLVDVQSVANILSSVLELKVVAVQCMSSAEPLKIEGFERADVFLLENLSEFKAEVANCRKFAELLSSGVDIFVNDSFSSSHKVLASTVGIARSCYASMAGFHFEKDLCILKEVAKPDKKPYVAIIGGGNLRDKAAALYFLASRCDGLVFIGMMLFQILHALGHYVPSNLIERGACKAALHIIQIARDRNIPILYPKDFWCMNDPHSTQVEVIPVHSMKDSEVLTLDHDIFYVLLGLWFLVWHNMLLFP